MKHLIVFLNFSNSRIDHPVYRLFAAESPYRRNSTLLYLPKPLEERELLHEVDELRRKRDQDSDVTFHICATLAREGDSDGIVATARLVRAHFAPDGRHGHPIFAYCLTPDPLTCSPQETKALWRNLVVLSKAASDYAHAELLRTVFIHSDASQRTLARYLFHSTRVDMGGGYLRPDSPADAADALGSMPPVFGAFNAAGIVYPEQETRIYLHQCYLRAVLRQGLADHNPIAMERCHAEAQRILAAVPLATDRLCLQAETFLNLGDDACYTWTPAADYWQRHLTAAPDELRDIPRNDWFATLRKKADLHYQSKFRNLGVEYFFAQQQQRTEAYAQALLAIIRQELAQSLRSHPFTPEAMKAIVRAIVNLLQQQALELGHQREAQRGAAEERARAVAQLEQQWDGRSFFSRFGGKDAQSLAQYAAALAEWQTARTWLPGFDFAVKLLNELIPLVAALVEPYDALHHQLLAAVASATQAIADNDPTDLYGIFASADTERAARAIEADTEHLRLEYRQAVAQPSGSAFAADGGGEDLLSRLRTELLPHADAYLARRIAEGTLPPVLNQPVTDRLEALYAADGGLRHYLRQLQHKTPLSLPLKEDVRLAQQGPTAEADGPVRDRYILIGPAVDQEIPMQHYRLDDISQLHLLHVLTGVRLTDLDGFAGQRMFVEPSIF